MLSLKLITIVLILLIVGYLAGLSFVSRHDHVKPEKHRYLDHCPDTPNCASSLAEVSIHAVEPFAIIDDSPPLSWEKLVSAIEQNGGKILVNDGTYCHAVFTSPVFRFKDDFEARLEDNQINVRSASRAGSSDLGQNRKRVEKLRAYYIGS